MGRAPSAQLLTDRSRMFAHIKRSYSSFNTHSTFHVSSRFGVQIIHPARMFFHVRSKEFKLVTLYIDIGI